MATRIVMHVDMDAFYASVELRRRPELRGTTGDRRRLTAGVVLSASYEAQRPRRTVRHAVEPGSSVGPQCHVPRPDFDSYSAVSKAIVKVFGSVTSIVESASIDEAFLDSPARSGCTAARP